MGISNKKRNNLNRRIITYFNKSANEFKKLNRTSTTAKTNGLPILLMSLNHIYKKIVNDLLN